MWAQKHWLHPLVKKKLLRFVAPIAKKKDPALDGP